MKQQVNFYSDEFKPKKELFTLENMLVVWLAGIVAVLVLYNYESEKAELAHNSWQMAVRQEQHQNQQLATLQQSFAKRGDAVVLEKTLADLKQNLQQREYVLEQLGLRADGMRKGVAGLMENLAGITIEGLWLTEIKINEGQLSVSGLTNDAEKVPQMIQRLQLMSSLQDRRFSRLQVKTFEDNEGLLSFVLQSENQINRQLSKKRGTR